MNGVAGAMIGAIIDGIKNTRTEKAAENLKNKPAPNKLKARGDEGTGDVDSVPHDQRHKHRKRQVEIMSAPQGTTDGGNVKSEHKQKAMDKMNPADQHPTYEDSPPAGAHDTKTADLKKKRIFVDGVPYD